VAHRTHRRQHKKLNRLRELERARHPFRVICLIEHSSKLRADLLEALFEMTRNQNTVALPADCKIQLIRPTRKLKRKTTQTDWTVNRYVIQ
jgi:uncharacterized membrane protein YgaE (UPF0421/DUF939 family)